MEPTENQQITDFPSNDSNPILQAKIDFFRRHGQAVYRYHMIRRSDPVDAQSLTVETFRRVLPAIDGSVKSETRAVRRLMDTARYIQAAYRRHAASLPAVASPIQQMMEETTALRAQLALTTDALRHLPGGQADALALHIFAGLSPVDVATAMHLNSEKTDRLIKEGLHGFLIQIMQNSRNSLPIDSRVDPRSLNRPSIQAEKELLNDLLALANEIQPAEDFLCGLENELSGQADHHKRWALLELRQRVLDLQAGFNRLSRRLAPVGALFVVLSVILFFIPHTSNSTNVLTDSPTPTPFGSSSDSSLPKAGWLVPLDNSACLAWKEKVGSTLGTNVALHNNMPIKLPVEAQTSASGTACEIDMNNIRISSLRTRMENLWRLMEAEGYNLNTSIDPNDKPSLRGIAEIIFHGSQGWAILSRINSLHLALATDSVSPLVQVFSNHWTAGDQRALDLLSQDLRKQLPDIHALDRVIGFNRLPFYSLKFTWSVIENTGGHLRLSAQVEAQGKIILPSRSLGSVQILLARQDGTWKIQAISNKTIFSPTTDSALVADSGGTLYLLSIENGGRQAISAPGFYQPVGFGRGIPPSLSPDQSWLVLPRQDGTWLLSLRGQPERRLSKDRLLVTWSGDGHQIAYYSKSDPRRLYLQDISDNQPRLLAQIPGTITGLTWAPAGNLIGVTYQIDSDNFGTGSPDQTIVSTIDATNAQLRVYLSFPLSFTRGNPHLNPLWTGDSSELWFLPAEMTINIETEQPRPLVSQPVLGQTSVLENTRPHWPGPPSQSPVSISAVSPDGQEIAVAYYDAPKQDVDTLAVQRSVTGKNNWIKVFGKIQALAWTQEGDNLIAAEEVDRPGRLRRVNPATGELTALSDDVIFLGLLSELDHRHVTIAPQVELTPLPAPVVMNGWAMAFSRMAGLRLQYPASWSYQEVGNGLGSIISLSSGNLSSWDGWASLGNNALYVTINTMKYPDSSGPPAHAQEMIQRDGQAGTNWEAVTLAGQPAYRLSSTAWRSERTTLMIPNHNQLILITKYPAASMYDWIFDRLLDTMQLAANPVANP